MRNVDQYPGNINKMNMAQDNQSHHQSYHHQSHQPSQNQSRRQPSGPVNMGNMSHPSGVNDILEEINAGGVNNRFDALSSASESTMFTRPGEKSQGRTAAKQKKRMMAI
jgi:hypothetical protein